MRRRARRRKLRAVRSQPLDGVHQQFNKGNIQQAQATVQDILKYAAMARDAAITSHGKMKQTEIVLRETQRRLEALKRTFSVNGRSTKSRKSWNNSDKTFWMRCLRRPRSKGIRIQTRCTAG